MPGGRSENNSMLLLRVYYSGFHPEHSIGQTMWRTICILAAVFAVSWLTSCRSTSNPYMAANEPSGPLVQVPGKARVVFKKERLGYYRVSIWDVTERAQPSLVAVLSPTMRAAHFVHPGEYFFLSISAGQRSLVKLTAVAQKTYCLYFRGDSFEPIKWGGTHPGTPTSFSVLLPTANQWAAQPNIRDSVMRHTAKAYESWSRLRGEGRKPFVLEAHETCHVVPSK